MPGIKELSGSFRHALHETRDVLGSSAKRMVSSTEAAWSRATDGVDNMSRRFNRFTNRLNSWADNNRIGRYFRFRERNAKFTVELRAGTIIFLMVAYILAVNPNILITTGGTCTAQQNCLPENAMEMGSACLGNADDELAVSCLQNLKRNLITATAASSLISTFINGALANLPLALAPGIGVNAYVAYQVIGVFGRGELTYEQTMATIFVESWIFILLSITGVRGGIIKFMPKTVALASSVGIGLLLAFTGLRNLEAVVFDASTLVQLGGCNPGSRESVYAFNQPLQPGTTLTQANITLSEADVYGCNGGQMRSPTLWLGIAGGFISALLLYIGVKGALIIGIFFVTVISWIPGHAATYLGPSSSIPGGEARLDVFKQIVAAPTLNATGAAWSWSAFGTSQLWVVLITLLYIDLLDCTGTLLSMAHVLDSMLPGFLDDAGEFPGQMWAFLADGVGILVGSLMGTTPLNVYIESAAGIEDGGRTGLTAIMVSFYFFVALFFSPVLASIPPYATGPALVLVGAILIGHVNRIEWDNIGEAIPALLTIILMPMTYSVAYGVIAGLGSYLAIHLPFWIYDLIIKRFKRRSLAAESGTAPSNPYMRRKAYQGSSFRRGPGAAPSEEGSYLSSASGFSGGLPLSLTLPSQVGLATPQTSFYDLPPGEDATAPGQSPGLRGRGRSFSNFRMSFDVSPHRGGVPGQSRGASMVPTPMAVSQLDLAALDDPARRHIRKVVPRPLARVQTAVPEQRRASAGPARSSKSMSGGAPGGGFNLFPEVELSQQSMGAASGSSPAESGGGGGFKLFGDVPDAESAKPANGSPNGLDGGGGFKLFGDVALPNDGADASERASGSEAGADGGGFRLFGDVEPIKLGRSSAEEAEAGEPTSQDAEPAAESPTLFLQPQARTSPYAARSPDAGFRSFGMDQRAAAMEREDTADLSAFGFGRRPGGAFPPRPPGGRSVRGIPRASSDSAISEVSEGMAQHATLNYEGLNLAGSGRGRSPSSGRLSSGRPSRPASAASREGGGIGRVPLRDGPSQRSLGEVELAPSSGSEGVPSPSERRHAFTNYHLARRAYNWGEEEEEEGALPGEADSDEGHVVAARSSTADEEEEEGDAVPPLRHDARGSGAWRPPVESESDEEEESGEPVGFAQRWLAQQRGLSAAELRPRGRSASSSGASSPDRGRAARRGADLGVELSTASMPAARPRFPWFPTDAELETLEEPAQLDLSVPRRSISATTSQRPGMAAPPAFASPFDAPVQPTSSQEVGTPTRNAARVSRLTGDWTMEVQPSGLRVDEEYDSDDGRSGHAARGRRARMWRWDSEHGN